MKIKNILTFLAALAVASIALNTSLSAGSKESRGTIPNDPTGVYCINSTEELNIQTKEKGLTFLFNGITRTGIPLWFYRNDTGFTVFYRTPARQYCTTPNYFGEILESASEGNQI
jgi:hypothetical protein